MPNHMKFCGCSQCRYGMHKTKQGKKVVQQAIRKQRYQTKQKLKAGCEEIDQTIGVVYTD